MYSTSASIRSMPYVNLGYEYAPAYEAGAAPDFAAIDELGQPQLHPNCRRHDGKLIYESFHDTKSARDRYLRCALPSASALSIIAARNVTCAQ